MIGIVLVAAALQALVMLVDEGWFHRRRGLGRWERLGHPVDTLSVAFAYAWLAAHPVASRGALVVYAGLAAFSSLLVTKDEPVHARVCTAGEHWLHALLFVLHPIVFVAFGALWWWHPDQLWLVHGQLALTFLLMIYQLVYWSGPWPSRDR